MNASLPAHRARLSTLAVDRGRIAYLHLGPRDGQPVVLVHGMPTSSYLYRRIADRLADAGLRVIVPDLLGFGASDKPRDTAAHTAEAQSHRITALLDHPGRRAGDLRGARPDLGGPWVFEIADREPQRVAALVVLNTSAYAELMTPPREALLVDGPIGAPLARLMGSRLGRRMIADFLGRFTHAGRGLAPEVVEAQWTPLHEGSWRAFRAFAAGLDAAMAEFSRYAAALRRLEVPATVIWGGEDSVLDAARLVPAFVADLGVDPADVHVLDAASHFLQEDRPDDLAAIIAAFVRR
ncbi:alpha/beta fold hydrolase [Agromyces sp. H66]|uniref:alpha/beta fold hydrolase n=1 Tax=Agromyces sp. H66 TaxID=2529859 RepID=UPI0010AA0C81|nr:alpha/beta fold hydrolase [Agromyces sp. H66]